MGWNLVSGRCEHLFTSIKLLKSRWLCLNKISDVSCYVWSVNRLFSKNVCLLFKKKLLHLHIVFDCVSVGCLRTHNSIQIEELLIFYLKETKRFIHSFEREQKYFVAIALKRFVHQISILHNYKYRLLNYEEGSLQKYLIHLFFFEFWPDIELCQSPMVMRLFLLIHIL